MDTIVFDIETKNFFTDPEVGWNNYDALRISVVGVYSYARNEYFCFEESEIGKLAELFRAAGRLVGFSMNRYDVPVLHRYFQSLGDRDELDLWAKERVDILSEIEMATGERISLDKLAHANLGTGKIGHGAEAIRLYREGNIEALKKYCLVDVRLTKELYDRFLGARELLIPDRITGEMKKVAFAPLAPASTPSLF